MIHGLLGGSDLAVQCSRAGCVQVPVVKILWRNPKIHDESRTKIWLACQTHVDYLSEFLRARNFPVELLPINTEEDE